MKNYNYYIRFDDDTVLITVSKGNFQFLLGVLFKAVDNETM